MQKTLCHIALILLIGYSLPTIAPASDVVQSIPAWSVSADQPDSYFGETVATAGDVNGDGYSDVIVGASLHSGPLGSQGKAFVYHGSAAGLSTTPEWSVEGPSSASRFGYAISSAGDVNGDGYDDILVGAFRYPDEKGTTYLYLGTADGLSTMPAWTVTGESTGEFLGVAVSTAGDVNADSFSDVIIGVVGYGNGQAREGAVYVYHGSASGLPTSPTAVLEGDLPYRNLGSSLASAGDVNNDGYDDIIVGSPSVNGGEFGMARVHLGSATGIVSSQAWTSEGAQLGMRFGDSVAAAGDTNGDGFADFLVGAPGVPYSGVGQAFAFNGTNDVLSTAPTWFITAPTTGTELGQTVAGAGDLNGDGFADILISEPRNGSPSEGRVYIFAGSTNGIPALPTQVITDLPPSTPVVTNSSAAAAAGDVNGDGYDDIIIGSPFYEDQQAGRYGRATVHYGIPAPSAAKEWSIYP